MQAWEERLQILEEGRSEGVEKGIRLAKEVLRLSAQGCSESEIAKLCAISPDQVRRILDT